MGRDCILAKDCPRTKREHVTVVSEHGINDTVAVHQGEFCFSLARCLQAVEARASVLVGTERAGGVQAHLMPCYVERVEDTAGGLDHPVVSHMHILSSLPRGAIGAIVAEDQLNGLSC